MYGSGPERLEVKRHRRLGLYRFDGFEPWGQRQSPLLKPQSRPALRQPKPLLPYMATTTVVAVTRRDRCAVHTAGQQGWLQQVTKRLSYTHMHALYTLLYI